MEDLIKMIQDKINFHLRDTIKSPSKDYMKGFISGLEAAKFLLEQKKESIIGNEDTSLDECITAEPGITIINHGKIVIEKDPPIYQIRKDGAMEKI